MTCKIKPSFVEKNYSFLLQSNVKIQATRLQHEIEDLQRRVETIKMKLTAEMKVFCCSFSINNSIISPDESRGYIGFRSVAPPPPPP